VAHVEDGYEGDIAEKCFMGLWHVTGLSLSGTKYLEQKNLGRSRESRRTEKELMSS